MSQIERIDSYRTQRILRGLILNEEVLARLLPYYEKGPLTLRSQFFLDEWANIIATQAAVYFATHGKPIGRHILEWFFEKFDQNSTPEAEQLATFIDSLADDDPHEIPLEPDVIVEQAIELMNRTKMKLAIERAELSLSRGDVEKAHSHLVNVPYHAVRICDELLLPINEDDWIGTFQNEYTEDLFRYSGRLGEFMHGAFCRDSFVAFMGADKVGKSFTLVDVAVRSVQARCRVAYFEAGDMSEVQVKERIGMRAAKLPLRPGTIEFPIAPASQKISEPPIWEKRPKPKACTAADAFSALNRIARGRDRLRLVVRPAGTLSALEISETLKRWEHDDGWKADVVVLDYADLLAAPEGVHSDNSIEQININWLQLRRISQEHNALVVTATQANAKAYDTTRLLTRRNFSGSKAKLAHVTAMVGLNVLPDDQKYGTQRWNFIVRRNARFSDQFAVRVAGCLDIAYPVLASWDRNDKKEEASDVDRDLA